ncbi:MAG TPA: glycosyltransferase family 9 protein [Gemmatimonadaceae bacterium]|nr:glycosyltransferase family 9 protein [Gemmatimonadaceae bacterium]
MLKQLERLGKRAATAVVRKFLRDDARGERPDWRARTYRVLFLRHDRIGDMILTTGILRAIAKAYPTIQLDVLASPINAPILRDEPYVREVVVANTKKPLSWPHTFAELRRRRYDAVIDCMITAPSLTTLLLMIASGARYRIGVRQGNDFAYTLALPPRESAEHLVDKLGALLAAFGLQPANTDLRPRVTLSAAERERGERVWLGAGHPPAGPRLLVNVSAGRPRTQWPDDRFVQVIRDARARAPNAEIIVVSSPRDRERASDIAEQGGARHVRDDGIRDAMAIVAASDLVFTPDTSIAHAASAFDKPAVVLYSSDYSRVWGPYRTDGRTIESSTGDVGGITAEEASRILSTRFASRSAR